MFLSFIFPIIILSQSAFYSYNTSHFARTIRLGNAYTGVADGTEALFYNVAGIANSNIYGFLFSKGQGYAVFAEDLKSYDYSLISPLPVGYGNIGFSINKLSYKFSNSDYKEDIYSLSYANYFLECISLGLTMNYYNYKSNQSTVSSEYPFDVSGNTIDLNFGALYELPDLVKFSDEDNFKIGFQIKNLLNSKIKYSSDLEDLHLFQNIRIGTSYNYIANLKKVYGLRPLKLLLAFDAVILGADYDFRIWQPNYGIELSLFEIIQISFGRENEEKLKEIDYRSPQHPVNRYGFGLQIPLDYLLNLSYNAFLRIDYSVSDWKHIDEDNIQPEIFKINSIDNKAFSLGLTFTY